MISSRTTYTWYRVDDDIPIKAATTGEHNDALFIPNVVTEDEGEYYCIAELFGHCAKSNRATVMVDGKKLVGIALVI